MKKALTLFFVLILFSNTIYGQQYRYIREINSDKFIRITPLTQTDDIIHFDYCEGNSSCVTRFFTMADFEEIRKPYHLFPIGQLLGSFAAGSFAIIAMDLMKLPFGPLDRLTKKHLMVFMVVAASFFTSVNIAAHTSQSNAKRFAFFQNIVRNSTNSDGNEDFFVFVEDVDNLWEVVKDVSHVRTIREDLEANRSVELIEGPQETSVLNRPSSTRENGSNLEELGENLVELGENLVEIGESLPEELEELKANMLAELKEELSEELQANLDEALRKLFVELRGEFSSVQQPLQRQDQYGLKMTVECSCYENDLFFDDYLGPSRGVGTTIQEAVSDARFQCPISRPVSSPEGLITKDCKIIGAEFYEKSDIPTVPIDLLKLLPTLDLNEVTVQ